MSSRALRARAWLSASVRESPSWLWALLAAVVVAAASAVIPLEPDMARQPDGDAWSDPSHLYGDYGLFVHAGRAILSGHPGLAYSDPTVQTGPLALVWAGGLAFLLHVLRASTTVGFLVAAVVALAPALYAASIWAARHRPPRGLFVAAVGAAVLLLVPWQIPTLIAYQHPTYLWVPALWLIAAGTGRRGRDVATALLLVAGCALETWAVLAVPVLLLALPTWRGRVRGAVVWLAGTVLVWAPFALSGTFRMLDMTWTGSIISPVLLLWGSPASVTWEVRATQGALIVVASVLTWMVCRAVTDAATVAVAVLVWTRVVTDTQWFPYYRLALVVTTGAIVLAAAAEYRRTRNARALAALGGASVMLVLAQAEMLAIPVLLATALHVAVLAALVVLVRDVPASPPETVPDRAGVS